MEKMQVNKISEDTKKSMWTRTITAAILALIGIPTILIGGWWFLIFISVALLIIIHEFINAPIHKRYSTFVHGFIYVMTFSFVFWIMAKNNMENVAADNWVESWSFESGFFTIINRDGKDVTSASISVSTIGVATTIFVLFFLSILDKNFGINDVTYLFTMSVFIGIAMQAILFLRYFPKQAFVDASVGRGWDEAQINLIMPNTFQTSLLLFYVIIGTFTTDIGAYFTGVLFGRNKMNERISPKKTWEGFVGGVITSTVLSFLFAFLLAYYKHPILKDIFDYEHWYNILIVSLIMPLTANLGDFIFSSIKRNYQVKDFGTLLKGHGGVLDRIDSLLVTSLVVTIIIIFMGHRWSFLL